MFIVTVIRLHIKIQLQMLGQPELLFAGEFHLLNTRSNVKQLTIYQLLVVVM